MLQGQLYIDNSITMIENVWMSKFKMYVNKVGMGITRGIMKVKSYSHNLMNDIVHSAKNMEANVSMKNVQQQVSIISVLCIVLCLQILLKPCIIHKIQYNPLTVDEVVSITLLNTKCLY